MQVLVNNAGIHDDAVLPGMCGAAVAARHRRTCNGFFNVTQPLLLPMIRTRWGRIINISSVAALTGNRGQVNYAAAKGAIELRHTLAGARSRHSRHHGQCRRARHHRQRT